MDKNSIVAARIKDLRLKKNMLQKHVASFLEISENAYSRIENGHTKLTIDYLFLISEALECGIEEILHFDKTEVNSEFKIIVHQINEDSFKITLSPSDFLDLKNLLESKK